jgi:hypothetical protein
MSAPNSPPPGAIPSGGMSPDMQSTLNQMMGAGGKTGQGGAPGAGQSPFGNAAAGGATMPKPPRPVGSLPQEAKFMAEDVAQGLLSVLPDFMQHILGVKPTDTPEEAARKKQMLQRYNQLNDEQQQVVQKQMQEAQAKKRQDEEDRMRKQQEAEQNASQDLPMPQGKTSGEGGPGASQKKRTVTKLQNDRKKLSSAG